MKRETASHFAVILLFGFLAVSAPISLPAAAINNESKTHQDNKIILHHKTLAKRYEHIAREMQTQIREEQHALFMADKNNSLPGNKNRHFNSSKLIKIRGCKHAVKENLVKAAYHRSMAVENAD